MPWPVYIVPVPRAHIAREIAEITPAIVIDMHASNPDYSAIVVVDIHITSTCDPSVIIIKYWNILYLNYGTVIAILYV